MAFLTLYKIYFQMKKIKKSNVGNTGNKYFTLFSQWFKYNRNIFIDIKISKNVFLLNGCFTVVDMFQFKYVYAKFHLYLTNIENLHSVLLISATMV